jgi:hypothetical protein
MFAITLWCTVLFGSLLFLDLIFGTTTNLTTKPNQLLNIPSCSDEEALLRALLLAGKLCDLSYEKSSMRHEFIRRSEIPFVSVVNIKVNLGEIVGQAWLLKDRRLFVVFRGTASFMDGLLNSRVARTTSFGGMGRVHAGFNARYRRVKRQLDEIIETNIGSFDRIIFTGHSLGGAIAMLAALDSARNKAWQPDVVTFGSPKVGDITFGRFFNLYIKSCIRIVVDHDPVIKLPPRFLGYHHVHGGCVLMLHHHSSVHGFFDKLEAHRLDTYQANLRLLSQ